MLRSYHLRDMCPTSVARWGSEGSTAGGRNTWGPRKAGFAGKGEAKTQVEFSACGKCNIVACALTKRVAGVGEGRRHIVAKNIRRAPQQGRYAEPLFIDVRRKDKTVLPDKMNSTPKAKHFGVLFIL